jgi:hypothetical protein
MWLGLIATEMCVGKRNVIIFINHLLKMQEVTEGIYGTGFKLLVAVMIEGLRIFRYDIVLIGN